MSERDELAGLMSQQVHGPNTGSPLLRVFADAILYNRARQDARITAGLERILADIEGMP